MTEAGKIAIDQKYENLKKENIDLGKILGDHQDIGTSGLFREYEKGRIFWTEKTGAHEVHGGILKRFLELGGPKNRDFGFPITDETKNRIEIPGIPNYPVSCFERGAIYWIRGLGSVSIYGPFYPPTTADYPIADPIKVANGLLLHLGLSARFSGPATDNEIIEIFFEWPKIGRPHVIKPEGSFPLTVRILAQKGAWPKILQKKPNLLRNIIEATLILQQVGDSSNQARLTIKQEPLENIANFSNLPALPSNVLGNIDEELLKKLEEGDTQARDNLLENADTDFRNIEIVAKMIDSTSLGGEELMSDEFEKFVKENLFNDKLGDFPPPQKKPNEITSIKLRIAVKNQTEVQDSTLYNLCVRVPGSVPRRIAPHVVYIKESWTDFGFIHATDLHISLRNDQARDKLEEASQEEGAKRYNNWNDAFRDLVHYANHLHKKGLLDFIVATGDIVDYYAEWPDSKPFKDNPGLFAYDPVPGSQKNLDLFIKLVLGQSPYPDPEKTKILHEELRVPIFTTMGNHDYRFNPYPLYSKVQLPTKEAGLAAIAGFITGSFAAAIVAVASLVKDGLVPPFMTKLVPDSDFLEGKTFLERNEFGNFNITQEEAKAIQGKTNLSGKDALKLLDAERSDIITLGKPSYMVRLGPHRLVMLDTGRDAGIFENSLDAFFASQSLWSNEDETNLANSAPNSMGINQKELNLVKKALVNADKDGLVIVGMHAPPLNPAGDEVPHYFRETEHPAADVQDIVDYLSRKTMMPVPFLMSESALIKDWQVNKDLTLEPTKYFKSGKINTLLDWGVASHIEGKTDDFLRLCAGGFNKEEGISKKVDLVLFGHVHKRIEYRLEWKNDELHYFMDFYSQNPKVYYPSRIAGDKKVLIKVTNTKSPGPVTPRKASDPDDPWQEWNEREIPKYARPLNKSDNPKEWWEKRKPILAQTAALGPMKVNRRKANYKSRPGPTFQGFRVLFVRNNVISKMRYVTMRNLRKNEFEMPWEDPNIGLPDEAFEGDDQEGTLDQI